jgi:nucleotide-binding universal stress UspA family protein
MMQEILLCFDGSPRSAHAIRAAGELLAAREALVLSVAVPAEDSFALDPLGDLVGQVTRIYSDLDEIGARLAVEQAQRGCEMAEAAGLNARPITQIGKPAQAILDVADGHEVAVIVLGSRRHPGLGGILGSVAARVSQAATRPVLIFPGTED